MRRGAHRARAGRLPTWGLPLAFFVTSLLLCGGFGSGAVWASEQSGTAKSSRVKKPSGVVRFRPNLNKSDAGVSPDGGGTPTRRGPSATPTGDGGVGTRDAGAQAASKSAPGTSGTSKKDLRTADTDPLAKKYRPAVGSQILAREEIHVGDRAELRVTVIHEKEVTVNLPAGLSLHDDVKVLKRRTQEPETLDNGKVKQEFILQLAPFSVGELELAPIRVIYTYPKGGASSGGAPAMSEVATEPVVLRVKSLMANEPSPRLKPNDAPVVVLEENRTLKIVLIVIGAVLAGILLGFLLFLFLRKRRRRPKPAPPPRPAHEVAFEKLRRLADSSLRDEERYTDFYFGVSEAFREYLGNRYDFDSLEMTTTELMDAMSKVAPHDLSLEELREFSEECDLVKFAKYKPTRKEADDVLSAAFDMVERSKKIEVQKESTSTGSAVQGAESGLDAHKEGSEAAVEDGEKSEKGPKDPGEPLSPEARERQGTDESESVGEELEAGSAKDLDSGGVGPDQDGDDETEDAGAGHRQGHESGKEAGS